MAEEQVREYQQHYRDAHGGEGDAWCEYLLSEINDWRGYHHRLEYHLYAADEAYHYALPFQIRHPATLMPGFVINNMSYAKSEQGETAVARAVAAAIQR